MRQGIPALKVLRFTRSFLAVWLLAGGQAVAQEKTYQVAVIGHSPPLSFSQDGGKLTGFNIEMAHELCATMQIRCELKPMTINDIVDAVASQKADFAVVGFIVTPERQQKVLFSKTYFQSVSVWLSRHQTEPDHPRTAVVVINGSAQAHHAQAAGWNHIKVSSQKDIAPMLSSGAADGALLPMLGALSLMQDKSLQELGLKTKVLNVPLLTGSLHMPIDPRQPALVHRINAALDQIKSDGRFDRINTRFIPFRLQ